MRVPRPHHLPPPPAGEAPAPEEQRAAAEGHEVVDHPGDMPGDEWLEPWDQDAAEEDYAMQLDNQAGDEEFQAYMVARGQGQHELCARCDDERDRWQHIIKRSSITPKLSRRRKREKAFREIQKLMTVAMTL